MLPDEKELCGNVMKMSAVALLAHVFLEVPVHEYGHYWVASLLGAPLYMDGERTIWATTQVVSPAARTIIFLSGGLCAGLVLLILFTLMRKPYRDGLLPLITANLVYAPFDATSIGQELSLIAFLAVWTSILGLDLVRFFGWFTPRARSVPAVSE